VNYRRVRSSTSPDSVTLQVTHVAVCSELLICENNSVSVSMYLRMRTVPHRCIKHSATDLAGVTPHAELVIRGSQSVPLGVQRSTLWIVEKSDKSELLFLSVKEFLHSRRWISRVVLRYMALLAATVIFFASFFAKSLLRPRFDFGLDIAVLASLGLFAVFVLMSAKQVSYATLRLRSKSQLFRERYSDKFATVIISTILRGLGTLALQWLRRILLSK
jgi:hypothetical protein